MALSKTFYITTYNLVNFKLKNKIPLKTSHPPPLRHILLKRYNMWRGRVGRRKCIKIVKYYNFQPSPHHILWIHLEWTSLCILMSKIKTGVVRWRGGVGGRKIVKIEFLNISTLNITIFSTFISKWIYL